MPEPIFTHPRLVEIYDVFDGPRKDLLSYLNIAQELKGNLILDVGCGTGCFATLLNQNNFNVIGIDPAEASVNFAKQKEDADKIQWLIGGTDKLTSISADIAFMTGNVAQVFLTDKHWTQTLLDIRRALKFGGHLVFETRDPSQHAWEKWNRDNTYQSLEVKDLGLIETWCDLIQVSGDLVSFRWTYVFKKDETILTSDSTLRFQQKKSIIQSLKKLGYRVKSIRDAPDRPKQEFVFIAEAV